MKLTQLQQQIVSEAVAAFTEKFVDHEGCQAGHLYDESCKYCRRWGGVEGEPKHDKRPLGTSRQIERFLTDQLTQATRKVAEETVMRLFPNGESPATQLSFSSRRDSWLNQDSEGHHA